MAVSISTGTSHGLEPMKANPLGGVRSKYPGPRAQISRDRSLAWWRRILPIIASHRLTFITSIVLSFVSLVFQTLVPNMLNHAITGIQTHSTGLHFEVIQIIVVGVLAGVTGMISRQYVYYTAYNVEADLRSLIYEHLTWLSFSFYDRVQSGQLISRANSDIRSVQMYSTFAPLIMVQCSIGIMAFGFMLSIASRPCPDRDDDHAGHVLHWHPHAPGDVSDLVDHPGSPGRGRHDRRREHQRRASGEVLRARSKPR